MIRTQYRYPWFLCSLVGSKELYLKNCQGCFTLWSDFLCQNLTWCLTFVPPLPTHKLFRFFDLKICFIHFCDLSFLVGFMLTFVPYDALLRIRRQSFSGSITGDTIFRSKFYHKPVPNLNFITMGTGTGTSRFLICNTALTAHRCEAASRVRRY
jgi:hypothetical protein